MSEVSDLLDRIANCESHLETLNRMLATARSKRLMKCPACGRSHQIRKLDLIQTEWYTPPSGCTGGDYWNDGEMQFVCPATAARVRILFNNHDVPWGERNVFANDPQEQFRRMYRELFKSFTRIRDDELKGPWINSHDVDNNRKRYELVEKRK